MFLLQHILLIGAVMVASVMAKAVPHWKQPTWNADDISVRTAEDAPVLHMPAMMNGEIPNVLISDAEPLFPDGIIHMGVFVEFNHDGTAYPLLLCTEGKFCTTWTFENAPAIQMPAMRNVGAHNVLISNGKPLIPNGTIHMAALVEFEDDFLLLWCEEGDSCGGGPGVFSAKHSPRY